MYNIKILNNEEFDALPYPEVDISLGLADPISKTAYIRATGIHELDKYVVMHELEHLVEGGGGKHANHYENGVYYKKSNTFFEVALPMIASMIPGVGPVAGAATAGAMQANKAKKLSKSQSSMDQFQPSGGSSAGFSEGGDSGPDLTPQPNIVTPGGLGGGASQTAGGMTQGSPVERLRGFFQGRDAGQGIQSIPQASGGV